eukprot:TRINITY_DN9299_c0_g1_i1.p1 TRINITY_DN9299_c0_g1~~TRINITY_DN9299_c0_g1_i1.p1  ORF type:complete len:479 (-),score=115.40 TRINITY_DN9299_c0_g1_i1:300-1736(-)
MATSAASSIGCSRFRRPAPAALSDDVDGGQALPAIYFPDTPEQWFGGRGRYMTPLSLDNLVPTTFETSLCGPPPGLLQQDGAMGAISATTGGGGGGLGVDFGLGTDDLDAFQKVPSLRRQQQLGAQSRMPVIEECGWSHRVQAQAPSTPPSPPAYAAPTLEEIIESQLAREAQSRPARVPLPNDLRKSLELAQQPGYRSDYSVKNTFIDFPSPMPPRLERRQAMSCPGSRLATPQSCRQRGAPMMWPPSPSKLDVESSAVSTVDTIDDYERADDLVFGMDLPVFEEQKFNFQHTLLAPPRQIFSLSAFVPSAASSAAAAPSYDLVFGMDLPVFEEQKFNFQHTLLAPPRQIFSLSAFVPSAASSAAAAPSYDLPDIVRDAALLALDDDDDRAEEVASEVDSAELPSIGSLGHAIGTCKPCAFHWKPAGCSNASSCTFCHLCDGSAKKERQKQKKVAIRTAKAAKAAKAEASRLEQQTA